MCEMSIGCRRAGSIARAARLKAARVGAAGIRPILTNAFRMLATYVCMYECLYVCVNVCMLVCIYVCMYVCICMCLCACVRLCVCVCACLCMHCKDILPISAKALRIWQPLVAHHAVVCGALEA